MFVSVCMYLSEDEEYIEYMTEEIHPDAISVLYDFDMSNMEIFHDLPDATRDHMNSLWEELKIESEIGVAVYIICLLIVISLVALLVSRIIINRRRRFFFEKYSKR